MPHVDGQLHTEIIVLDLLLGEQNANPNKIPGEKLHYLPMMVYETVKEADFIQLYKRSVPKAQMSAQNAMLLCSTTRKGRKEQNNF